MKVLRGALTFFAHYSRGLKVTLSLFLILLFSSLTLKAGEVSLSFAKGYIGTIGQNTGKADNIKTFTTLGIARVSFSQVDLNGDGKFGDAGTQGNDLAGTIRLYFNSGQIISLPGALNWREGTTEVYGIIFDAAVNQSFTYGNNLTFTIRGGSVSGTGSNLGLKAYLSTVTFTDGQNRSGNAATSSILGAMNAELLTLSPQPSSITSPSVVEGNNLVYTVTLTSATAAGNPQVYTFAKSGTSTATADYTTFTFSNGVINNGDGTITVPGGVSNFTITVTTVDDSSVESTETLELSVGSKTGVGSILDNDGSITATGTLSGFSACAGTSSAAQSFTFSGAGLSSSVQITAPTGFELATSQNGTYAASLTYAVSGGAITTTTVWVRTKSTAISGAGGNITLVATGAPTANVAASAIINALPTITVNVIPDVTTSATTFSIPYTGLTGADVYSVVSGTTSMTNFVAVSNATITANPFVISIPASVQNSYDFILTVKNNISSCSVQRSFNLVVSDINPGTTGTDQAICFGATPVAFTSLTDATAVGAGSPTYQWQMSTTGVAGTYSDIVNATSASYAHPTALTVDTYFRRKATIGVAFGTAHPIEVIVNPLPLVAISPSFAAITTGTSLTLTASGASSYSWTPSGGLSATNTATVTATPTLTTTYIVTGTNSPSACTSTATVTITVNPALTAGAISADQTICVGAIPAAFTSTTDAAGGTGSITYVWESSTDGTSFSLISGVASSTYSPGAISVNTYFRRGASTANDAIVYSSPVLITVQESVGGSIAGSATVCAGTNSTVLTLSGQTGSITKWQSSLTSNFASATDISNTTASLTATNLSATTYYRAVITQGSCTAANSASATISVTALPSISVTPSSASITTGSSVSLTASGASTYSWSPSTGLSATNTAAVSASPTVTTTYTVTGTSSSCSSTATITVTVTAAVSPDTDGDGVLDSQETTDGTDPNDGCSYVAASKTVTPSAAWNALDCDGDGTLNGTDTAPKDPCVFVAGATPVTTNAIWRAADCDGDGVTNGKETDDGTDPNDGCSYVAASKTVTPSAAWNALDCDGDGTPNGTDTAPKDPCVFVAGATPVTTNAIWRAADCDGDGVTNGKETDDGTDPNDGCSYVAASKTVTPSAAWNALDCDGDGTPNGTDTAPKDPCVFVAGATPVTTNAIWRAADCDGDGVTNGKETDDGTDPNDGCSYVAASKTVTPSAAWNALDCDGDGTPNGTDTAPKDPCVFVAGATPVTTNAIWRAADCDGDGVTNGKETDDGTDPNDGCSYVAASKTVTPSAAWNALDCDGDGTPNGTDTAPKDPCVFVAGATPVTTNAIWRAADCDGDGVTNGKETDDGTDPTSGCSFTAASKTLTPTSAWGTLDCDSDGNPNATDPNNDKPTASNDVVSVGSSGIATINILSNDDYLPGPNIEITRQTGANAGTAKGTVTFNPLTGEMTYKRAPFESGLVTLGYRVSYKVGGIEVFANAFVTILSCDLQDPLADCDGDGEPNGTDIAPSDPCVFEPTRQVKANVSDDWKALDCDGDGVLNGTELSDGTNPADGCSFKAESSTLAPSAAWLLLDCDADGISNKAEGKQDFDGDGIPNCLDTDSDGDSISDKLETTVDTDKDGKSDYLDLDSDNDGILDSVENKVCTGTGILCDTDADGFPNFRDLDSDGDQILDVKEANGADFNQDGIADGTIDEKGIPSSANKGLSPPDTDKDVKLDPYDVDSDGDGISDKDEEFNEDADFADCDKDGVPNRLDPDECEVFSPQGISPNGDGKNDRLVFKGLLLRKTPNHLSIYNRWGTLVFEMESYDNSFEGTLLPDGTYYYILDFFGKKPTISNYLSVDRTIK
ncbi:MAG: hypothetical protein RLZZ96_295 [Bacteroidota bacterium]